MTAIRTGESALLLNGRPPALVVDVSWDSGLIPCEAAMFVCGTRGRVLSNDFFVWQGAHRSLGGEVVHRCEPPELPQRAQFQVHLAALPDLADQVDVVLGTRERDLEHVTDVRVVVWDPVTGREVASYDAPPVGQARSSLLARLYLHAGVWKLEALGTHHDRDIRAVAQEYGVTF